MLINLHGQFAKDYGAQHYIEANTVADAVEGFSRQIGFYSDIVLEDRPIVRIVGYDREEDLFLPTEQKEIHLVPAMIGGGGNFGRILLGAALVAFVVATGGAGGFLGATFSAAIAGAGIGMILSGVMGYLIKAPTISKDGDPEASKYLGLSDNTVSIGTPISIKYGRGPATGHILALNVDSTDMMVGTFPAVPT